MVAPFPHLIAARFASPGLCCAKPLFGPQKRRKQPGTTNEALCELIPVYRSAGLTPELAAAEFAALLVPRYEGELRNGPRLLQRVRSFYQKTPETRFTVIPKEVPVELFTEQIAEAIVGLYTGPTETSYQRGALTKKRNTIM